MAFQSPDKRRRWVLPTVITAVVALIAAGLLITTPWASKTDDTVAAVDAGASPAGDVPTDEGPQSPPPKRLIFDKVPEDFQVQWIQDPAEINPADFGGADNQAVLLAKPDANFGGDGWIAVLSRPMDRFERRNFNPANDGQMESPRKLNVGSMAGVIGRTFEGYEMLTFGPMNDGYAVSVAGPGLSQVQLTELASLIELTDDGQPTVRSSPAIAGYEPLGVFHNVWGVGALADGGMQQSMMSVNYSRAAAEGWMGVSNVAVSSDDPLKVARFFLKSPVDGTVHGQPAIAGDVATMQPMPGQPARAIWIEDGYLVAVSANKPADELLALAETVREATPDEWTTMKDEVKRMQEEMSNQNVIDTWMIGAGDTADSTTWVLEGGFTDEGTFTTSMMLAASDGSGMSGGGNGGAGREVTYPYLEVQPNSMGMPGGSGTVNLVVALVALDTQGAILRFTPADGSAASEAPLHVVRDDWPALAAALGVSGEVAGKLEIIAADGSVLTSKDVEALDAVEAGNEGGAPGATVAAAVAVGG